MRATFIAEMGFSSSENEEKVGFGREGVNTGMERIKLPGMNEGVREDQRKVEGVNHLLEKENRRSGQAAVKEKLPCHKQAR